MKSPAEIRSQLKTHIGSGRIVNIQRRSRPGSTIDGFVLAVGRDWVLLSKTTEGGYFDGHAGIRISDIQKGAA